MKFSVSVVAEGDRPVTLEEVVELADAVAIHSGIASGAGSHSYGAQLVVEAPNSDEAVDIAMSLFSAAVITAKLPDWPISRAETLSEDDDFYDLEDE
jgi:hypothetical protein